MCRFRNWKCSAVPTRKSIRLHVVITAVRRRVRPFGGPAALQWPAVCFTTIRFMPDTSDRPSAAGLRPDGFASQPYGRFALVKGAVGNVHWHYWESGGLFLLFHLPDCAARRRNPVGVPAAQTGQLFKKLVSLHRRNIGKLERLPIGQPDTGSAGHRTVEPLINGRRNFLEDL